MNLIKLFQSTSSKIESKSATGIRSTSIVVTSGLTAFGIVMAFSVPAQAFSKDVDFAAADNYVKPESQSLVVSAEGIQPDHQLVRDGYTITKPPPPPPPPVARVSQASSKSFAINPPAASYSGSALVAYAKQFVGKVPYGSGNSPSTSFSCDGLTQYVFAAFGISLPRMADSQAARGIRISAADAVAGDLLWWPGQHIGIYDGAGRMIDSPKPGHYVEHRAIWGNPVYIRIV